MSVNEIKVYEKFGNGYFTIAKAVRILVSEFKKNFNGNAADYQLLQFLEDGLVATVTDLEQLNTLSGYERWFKVDNEAAEFL